MKLKIMALLSMLFILAAGGALSAAALPLSVDKAQIDNYDIWPDQSNRLSVEKGQEFEFKISLTAWQDIQNLEAEVFIAGYEYSDYESISDRTHNFDMEANVTYSKTLTLKLPSDIDVDNYKLRLIISDRYGDQLVQRYNLKIDAPRHSLRISDLEIFPENQLVAGRAIVATVRVENLGEKDEENVKVTASIPELGLSDSAYLNDIEAGDEEGTEELYMRIPTCAKEGLYDFNVELKYDRKRETITETRQIKILESESCGSKIPMFESDSAKLSMKAGESKTFRITVENNAASSKALTISLSTDDWAETRISPSSTAVISAGESETFTIHIDADKKAAGSKKLIATLSSGNKALGKLEINVDVSAKQSGFKLVLETVLVVLVAVLVVIALVFGVSKLKQEQNY